VGQLGWKTPDNKGVDYQEVTLPGSPAQAFMYDQKLPITVILKAMQRGTDCHCPDFCFYGRPECL